jgi:hypothetical protein
VRISATIETRHIPSTDWKDYHLSELADIDTFITDGHVEGLQASLILLAKRMGWDTTYRQLLCHKLIPLIDEWRAGAVSDRTIAEVIIVMGMLGFKALIWRTQDRIAVITSAINEENLKKKIEAF